MLVGGIRSTGLTASMAIAEHVRELLAGAGLALRSARRAAGPAPRCPTSARRSSRPYQDDERIAARPGLRPHRLLLRTGHRRRDPRRLRLADPADATSTVCAAGPASMNGRCQGFFCGAEVAALLDRGGTRAPSDRADERRDPRPRRARRRGGPAGSDGRGRAGAHVDGEVLVLEREAGRRRDPAAQRPSRLRHPRPAAVRSAARTTPAGWSPRRAGAGATIRTERMVTGWTDDGAVAVTSPAGRLRVERATRSCWPPAPANGRARPGSSPVTGRTASTPPANCRTSSTCTTRHPARVPSSSAPNSSAGRRC